MGKRSLDTGKKHREVRPKKQTRSEAPEKSAAEDEDFGPVWLELRNACPDHPALEEDTIYALPERLITTIQAEIPGFFTKKAKVFERILAKAGGGLFLKRAFSYEPLHNPVSAPVLSAEEDQLEERIRKSDEEIRRLVDSSMIESGRTCVQIEKYRKRDSLMAEHFDNHRWGYAGWLATHATFRQERDRFRQKWGLHITEMGKFPIVPPRYSVEPPSSNPELDRDFDVECTYFFNRWGLESFATWELPIPMRPELFRSGIYSLRVVEDAGITIFLPRYLLRDPDLKVRELLEHELTFPPQPHLQEWLDHKPKHWSYSRYATMLRLYVYLELGLAARYSDQAKGKKEKLSHSVGIFLLNCGLIRGNESAVEDSIKKTRQQMQKRLGQYPGLPTQ